MMQYTPDEVKDEPAVGALIPATNDSQVGRETATQWNRHDAALDGYGATGSNRLPTLRPLIELYRHGACLTLAYTVMQPKAFTHLSAKIVCLLLYVELVTYGATMTDTQQSRYNKHKFA